MNRSLLLCLLVLVATITTAHAAVIQTIAIPTDGTTVSSTTLASGINYILEVSGFFNVGGGNQADAEYYDFGNPKDFNGAVDIGVSVDQTPFDWGAYSPTHVYSGVIMGTGVAVDFSYADTEPGDNEDKPLSLTISAVPEPTSLLLLSSAVGGLVVFRKRVKA